MSTASLIRQLRLHEGVEKCVYIDTVGKRTVGVGRNLDDVGLDEDEIDLLLMNDIQRRACNELSRVHPAWVLLSEPRQDVLIDMMFNLGAPTLQMFEQMWQAIRDQRWADAAEEMLDSKWARQVGNRALRLAKMMEHNIDFDTALELVP